MANSPMNKLSGKIADHGFLDRPPGMAQPSLSVYDVAALLGIGATTVCQDEKSALAKLRTVFSRLNVSRLGELEGVDTATFKSTLSCPQSKRTLADMPYRYVHGWEVVSRLVSLNGGSECIRETVLVFQILREKNKLDLRLPLFERQGATLTTVGSISRLVEWNGGIRAQVTNRKSKRTSSPGHLTLFVESEFGRDELGTFDLPVAICGFWSTVGQRRGKNGE
jgi:hypothetical protein